MVFFLGGKRIEGRPPAVHEQLATHRIIVFFIYVVPNYAKGDISSFSIHLQLSGIEWISDDSGLQRRIIFCDTLHRNISWFSPGTYIPSIERANKPHHQYIQTSIIIPFFVSSNSRTLSTSPCTSWSTPRIEKSSSDS